MSKTYLLAPSILSADFSHLSESIKYIEKNKGDWVHIDVMDGHFVPNLTFGPLVVKAIKPLTTLPFDVHLMVDNPESLIESFVEAGADWITFHVEAVTHAHRLLSLIKSLGCKAGVSIVPSTPISFLQELLPFVDQILIMSVNPGFGGQTMIPQCLEKIKNLIKIRNEEGFSYIVSIDGGVNSETLSSVIETGVDVIITGSAFFSGEILSAL